MTIVIHVTKYEYHSHSTHPSSTHRTLGFSNRFVATSIFGYESIPKLGIFQGQVSSWRQELRSDVGCPPNMYETP